MAGSLILALSPRANIAAVSGEGFGWLVRINGEFYGRLATRRQALEFAAATLETMGEKGE